MSNERYVICQNDWPVEVMTNESTLIDAEQRCWDKKNEWQKRNPGSILQVHFHYCHVPLVAPGDEA